MVIKELKKEELNKNKKSKKLKRQKKKRNKNKETGMQQKKKNYKMMTWHLKKSNLWLKHPKQDKLSNIANLNHLKGFQI